jgi:hypothetical protein
MMEIRYAKPDTLLVRTNFKRRFGVVAKDRNAFQYWVNAQDQ